MKYILTVFLFIVTINLNAQTMTNQDFKIDRITIAVTNVDQMVKFYKTVFKCELKESKAYGTILYSGKLGDIKILLCPNEIAGVKADQNRQQFDFIVTDLDKIIQDSKVSGGKMKGDITTSDKQKSVTIVDPDGNTIVFIQTIK